jgi:D-alanyl-D-alanine carboxypeptidase (penicillin-binding protein 5/6)
MAGGITARHRGLLILLFLLLAGWAFGPAAAQGPSEFTTKARNAILMDAATGAILYQLRAEDPVSPASMSKLMTAVMAFKALKAQKLRASDEFVMSVNAWRTGGAPSGTSAMMVPVNTKARLDELLQGIIVQSGNDASIAIAEGMAGSEAAFAKLMEQEGRRIGLRSSTFRNATGLHDPEHLMTARDLAVLARHIITEYPEYYPLFAQKEFQYRKHKFVNRNPLLFANIGVEGMKTGHIKESGFGMVLTARQDGRRLIAVVCGLSNAEERKSEAQKLIEHGFKSFTEYKVFDAGETVGQARVWGGNRMFVPLVGHDGVGILLPRFPANQRLKADIVYKGPLKAPIQRGDVVAHLRVTSTSGAINEVPLAAAEEVARAGVVRRGLDTLMHLTLRWVLL